jgi:sugar/nucleoside kinase (ribokinase family)
VPDPVLVVGSIGIDTVETPGGRADDVLGGSVVYFAAAASIFAPVRLVSVVGEDFPEEAREKLASRDIDLAGLEVVPGGRTFRWHGKYSDDMNDRETVSVDLNVLGEFKPKLPEVFKDTPWVFLANGPTATQHSVADQMEGSPYIAADTMNLWIETERAELDRLLGRIDLLVLNDSEARMLTGVASLWDAAGALVGTGPKTVALKKGEHGSYLAGEGGPFAVPSYPIGKLVDPTGAGDSFAGALMGCLARDGKADRNALRRALATASVVASFTCESLGPDSLLAATADDIESRLETLRELTRF